MKNRFYYLSSYYMFVFFGLGAVYPMMGVFLEEAGLTGSRIGIIMSVGPIVAIFAQPLWGMLSDRLQNPKGILTITTFLTGISAILFLFTKEYLIFILIAMLLALFQSAIIPLSDSLTVNYVKKNGGEYGAIRLWGAIGFALAVWFAGLMIEFTYIGIIYIIFFVALFIATIITRRLPDEAELVKVDLRSGLIKLIKIPSYIIFLLSTFLIFGAISANNFYFVLYYTSIGGTLTGAGLVFLISAGSEAPFMRIAGHFIRKYGLVLILIFSSLLAALRWLFFFYVPSPFWILAISIFQGLAVGFYIPAAVQIVNELTPPEIKMTGMSIYASLGNGLGAMFFTFLGGYIFEYFSIQHTYLFFGLATLIGTCLLLIIYILNTKKSYSIS